MARRSKHPVNKKLIDEAPRGARIADQVTGFLGSWRFIIVQTRDRRALARRQHLPALEAVRSVPVHPPEPGVLDPGGLLPRRSSCWPAIGPRLRDRMTLEHAAAEADIEDAQNRQLLEGNVEILKRVEALEHRILDPRGLDPGRDRSSGPRGCRAGSSRRRGPERIGPSATTRRAPWGSVASDGDAGMSRRGGRWEGRSDARGVLSARAVAGGNGIAEIGEGVGPGLVLEGRAGLVGIRQQAAEVMVVVEALEGGLLTGDPGLDPLGGLANLVRRGRRGDQVPRRRRTSSRRRGAPRAAGSGWTASGRGSGPRRPSAGRSC